MPKITTWFALVGVTLGLITYVEWFGGPPKAASGQGIQTLTPPVPPMKLQDQMQGGALNQSGWRHANKRLGNQMPAGRGIVVGQVESVSDGGYVARTNQFGLEAMRFVEQSGESKASGHANYVARNMVGDQSVARGVRQVYAWSSNHWLGPGMLNVATTNPPVKDSPVRVFNHSWIGGASRFAPLALRRVDYLVDHYDKLVVCGVNNKHGAVPAMLGSAYNVISVGVVSGNNSNELTTIEGEGRSKPEIVGPGSLTSWSTGFVTGCVAALIEGADELAQADEKNKDAARSETIKAILLAGARKNDAWQAPEGEPLDRKYGAGFVDIDRALLIQEAGHVEPDTATRQRYGWSFSQVNSAQQRTYRFTLGQDQGKSTFALTWHRRIMGGTAELKHTETGQTRTIWNSAHFAANLDLALVRLSPDNNPENHQAIAVSSSKVNNVELIYAKDLKPGRYVLTVTRQPDKVEMAWDYALAWRIEALEE